MKKKPKSSVASAWADEIKRRLEELDSGKVKPIPWEVARKDLLRPKRHRKRRS